MNEFSWIPGTVVLVAGSLAGLFFAFLLRRPAPAKKSGGKKTPVDPAKARRVEDLELRIADLEARRDELYARLRGEGVRELEEDDLRTLELAAARTLRDLDQAHAELGDRRPRKAKPKAGEEGGEAVATPVPAPATAHHPFLWFAMGAGLMGLVAALVYFAQQDAQPDPMATQTASTTPSGGQADHPVEGLDALSPDVRQRAEALQAQLAADPNDLTARKELAVLLAQNQQFFAAFQHATVILESSPDDPDALYISGVVRVAMGRAEEAVGLIDRVLAQFPEHVLAHLVRGTALLQLERRDEALASWQAALQAAGGSNAQIEGMIASEFGSGASTGTATAGAPSPPTAPAAVDTGEPKVYRVYAEVVSGAVVPPGASLFVSVHNAGGGPPAAVRAVRDPKFPLEVTLTQDDSNTGIPLPAQGLIMLRLDSDGNPGTESPDDLTAQGEGTSGELAKFVLW